MPKLPRKEWPLKPAEYPYEILCAKTPEELRGDDAGVTRMAFNTPKGRMVVSECRSCSMRNDCDFGARITLHGLKILNNE